MAFGIGWNPDPSVPVENIGEMRAFTRDYCDMFRLQNPQLFGCDWQDEHISPMRAFENCAVLRTVVTRCAQAMSLGKWYVLNKSNLTGDDIVHRHPKIGLLLDNPNRKQVWSEFIIQSEIYRQLFGASWIYASVPEGRTNNYAGELWCLPPSAVSCFDKEGIAKIKLHGEVVEVPLDRLVEIKDSGKEVVAFGRSHHHGYLWSEHAEHRGRVHAARFAINNVMIAEQSMYEINRDRGALGMLVDDSNTVGTRTAITPKEEQTLLEKLRSFGMNRGRFKHMVVRHPMKWVPMSMNVRDLQLIEGMGQSVQTICNAFDYPKEMLVSDSKYSNKETAKGFYDESVIPFSQIYASKFKKLLLPPDAYFVIDFSEVPAMKEAEKEKATVFLQKTNAVQRLYQDGVISREEARLELGYEETIEGVTMFNEPQNIQQNG